MTTKQIAAGIAVAVTTAAGGALAIDETYPAIAIECNVEAPFVSDIDKKLTTYKVDQGFLNFRDMGQKDRAAIKGCEVAKVRQVAKETRATYAIEITDIRPIEGGVEAFAKVWKDGVPVGFGVEGSVEIERFRIFNPPVLVPDQNGPVKREVRDETGKLLRTDRLREDPGEALLQTIEHNLSVMENVHVGSQTIEPGKVGRTTSTFYPDAGSGGANTTVDGFITSGYSSTMQLVHDDTNGDGANVTSPYGNRQILTRALRNASGYYLGRSFFLFNTAAIDAADTISSATLSLYGDPFAYGNPSATTFEIVASNPASNTTLATTDFDNVSFTSFASIAFGSMSQSAYNNFALNASGIANINKDGISKFGSVTGLDLNVTSMTSGHDNIMSVIEADQTGTTQDPKLVVEHAAGASTPRRIIQIF